MPNQTVLGGLNYDAVLSAEDYRTYRDLLEKAIIDRFKLASGSPPNTAARFGIVDVINPALISTTEPTRPLLVKLSTLDATKVDVNPGYAVSPSGAIMGLPSGLVTQQVLEAAGSEFLVDLPYALLLEAGIDSSQGSNLPNDYMVNQWSQEVATVTFKSVRIVNGWTPTENQVVLGVVNAFKLSPTQYSLQLDLTQNIYPYTRPWYSVIDMEHRSYVGSGQVTDTNPHGTSVNDLTPAGTVGLFQGLSSTGLVVSRDRVINKMTGAKLCVETVPYTRVKTDASGAITAGSPYSKAGALYVELVGYPARLGSVYDESTPAYSLAAEMVPKTNILVLGPNETVATGQTLVVEYTQADALLPPVNPTTNLLTFGVPGQDEVIVAGGLTFASIPDPTVSLEGLGPFAREYHVSLTSEGSLIVYPQVVLPAIPINTSLTPAIQPSVPSRISIGVTNTTGSPSFGIVVVIQGKDENNTSISETLTINADTGFMDQSIPSGNYDLPGQLFVTENRFSFISAVSVSGTFATEKIQMWAETEAGTCPEVNDVTCVALVQWNGQAVSAVLDQRVVSKGWSKDTQEHFIGSSDVMLDSSRLLSYLQGSPLLTTGSVKLMTEDFEDLRFFDSSRGYVGPTTATGVISLNASVPFTDGDTITLSTSPLRILTAVTAAPVASSGQFQIVGTLAQIRANIIAAINDVGFDSKITASTPSPDVPTNIALVLQTPTGAGANNVTITKNLANTLSCSVSGFNFAMDGFGEAYMERCVLGLRSPRVPPGGNLNPYQYAFRKRYRSRALALPNALGTQEDFAVLIHGELKTVTTGIRIRGALASNPQAWLPWAVMTAAPAGEKGLYLYSFAGPVHKVQVEHYGLARGL